MSSSSSSPTNTTQTTTNASETNLSAANTSGVTLVGNKGTTTLNDYSTDDGAVTAGTNVAQLAIASNTGLTESLASDYEHEVETNQTASTNLVNNTLTQGFNFLSCESKVIQNIETQNASNLSAAYGNYATTLSNISTAQDTSLASQSTQFATSALKIAAVVVLGLAVIYFATKK